jgi:hypothetical protein
MHLCYWIVGANTGRPFVAIDLLHDDGRVYRSRTFPMGPTRPKSVLLAYAYELAYAYGQKHNAITINYDDDSTQFYARD